MSQAPALPMFVDAMLGDTLDLSPEEFGAYHLVLYAIWRNNGQPLPDDDAKLARICRVTPAKWRRVLRPALAVFFDQEVLLRDGAWQQNRLKKEWNFVANRRASQSEKGKASARAKAQKNNETPSTGVVERLKPESAPGSNPRSTPIPIPSKKEKNLTTTPVPDDSARDHDTGGGGEDRSQQEGDSRAQVLADKVQDILGVDVSTDRRWWNATQAVARMLLAGTTEAEVIAAANEAKRSTTGKQSPGPGYVEKIAARLVAERPAAPAAPPAGGHLLTEERPYLRLWKASKSHRTEITRRAAQGDDDALDRWATGELDQLRAKEAAS